MKEKNILFVCLLFCVVSGLAPDIMTGHRTKLEGFSLGPAPFPDFRDMHFELFGDAFIRGDAVKVTDAKQHQKGAIWSRNTMVTKDTPNFQVDLTFRVGGSPNKELFGDGFALWFVDNANRGVGGNALGGPNKWNGLALFFDTFKNNQFKGKKHPFVYAYVNDGKKVYDDITSRDVDDKSCHVPFRARAENVLDTTVARVTYLNKQLSVLMKPFGSEDWLQCFKIKEDVSLPEKWVLGVTAMTGELVDKHHMVGVQLYSDIEFDPYESDSVKYDTAQVAYTWDEMKHSGDIAKDFEDWEADMESELDSFRIEEDDYYKGIPDDEYGYGGENYYADDATDDDYYENSKTRKKEPDSKAKFEKPSYKNYYRKDVRKKANENSQVDLSEIKLTDGEVKKIDEMITGTKIASEIRSLHESRRARMRKFRLHMEAEFTEAQERINDLVRAIKTKEFELSRRIEKVGGKLHIQVKEIFRQSQSSSSGFVLPFILLFIFVLAGTIFGYVKYTQHMKTHLL